MTTSLGDPFTRWGRHSPHATSGAGAAQSSRPGDLDALSQLDLARQVETRDLRLEELHARTPPARLTPAAAGGRTVARPAKSAVLSSYHLTSSPACQHQANAVDCAPCCAYSSQVAR